MTVQQDDRTALALQALAEVTDPASVGELVESVELEPGVRNLVFASRLPGYVGWRWTVSTAQIDGAEPTVLEVELLPGEGALLAPPWVPWTERLAEYRRTHPDEPGPDDADDEDLDDEDDEDEVDETDVLEIDGVEFEDSGDEDDDVDDDVEEEPGAADPVLDGPEDESGAGAGADIAEQDDDATATEGPSQAGGADLRD